MTGQLLPASDVPKAPSALPRFWELRAPAAWTAIDFISDLHLSATTGRTFDAWAHHLRHTSADAVFMLGDLFEVWVGDDARHSGFEAQCAEVLADAASRRTLGFMQGNRDFLVGSQMLQDCGVMAMADPTVLVAFGERVLLSHGDLLCVDDVEYQRFRARVRGAEWQREFLLQPLAQRRELARQMRDASELRKTEQAVGAWYDIDAATAVRWMHEAGTPTLIHGHTHRPGSAAMAPGFVRHVLSDWDFDDTAPPRAEVLRWRGGALERVPLAAPTAAASARR